MSVPSPTASSAAEAPLPPAPVVRATRALCVLTLLALIALCLSWELWLAPTGQGTLAWKTLPLLLPLTGLLRLRLYTYRWLSLMIWLYVIEGLVRATGPASATTQLLAWAEVLLCLLLFVGCTVHVRWRLRHPRPAA